MVKRFSKLAGVTFSNASNGELRQRIIRDLSRQGMLENGTCLIPVREPNNPYDPNAVAVCAPDGRQLGYLRKEDAAQVAKAMDSGANCQIIVNGVTGGDAENVYGVNIIIQIEENKSDDLLQSKNMIDTQNRAPSAVKFNLESEVNSADAEVLALGEGWKRTYPQYEQFAKKVSNSPYLIFITNIYLYLYNTNDGHCRVLTSNNQHPLAYDIQRNTVFALVCDYSTGAEVCNLLKITIGTDASIRKEVLLSLPAQVSEECKSFLFCVDNLVYFSTGCINTEYSFASFNTETGELRYFATLADYEIKECVASNNTAWLIAVNKKDYSWPPKHFLYYWNTRTNECLPILESSTITSLIIDKGSKYSPASIPQIQANTIIRFCVQEDAQQAIKYIVAEEAVRGQVKVKTDDKNAYYTDKYKISFIENEKYLGPEDGYMVCTHIDSFYRYSKVLSCQSDLEHGISSFCVVGDELYICYQGSWLWRDDCIRMLDLTNKSIPIDLIIDGLSIPERELTSRLKSSVIEEYYAIEAWAKEDQPINPAHAKICNELSRYEVIFGNFGACHIKNCATRARPIVQICLDDGTEKTFLVDAFKKSISVKDDDGVQLLRVKQLIDDALIIPEKIEKKPFKSANISWGAAFEEARKAEMAISSECRTKRPDEIAMGTNNPRGFQNQERIDCSLLNQERIIKDVSMYVILDNEKILGYHNRPSKAFFNAYRDFFSPFSEEELNDLRLKIQANSAQKQYQDYYNSVLSQQSLNDRFKMIVLNLFNELDSCGDVSKRAQFAVSSTRKWFLRSEHTQVDILMETELENLKHRLTHGIGEMNPAWSAYETARPYLEITQKSYVPCDVFGLFSNVIGSNVYVVQLRSNACHVELSNSMAWVWDTSVSEVWKDALFNTLLKQEDSYYDCTEYCEAVAKAMVSFGNSTSV